MTIESAAMLRNKIVTVLMMFVCFYQLLHSFIIGMAILHNVIAMQFNFTKNKS